MICQVLGKAPVCTVYLLKLLASVLSIVTPAAQPKTDVIRIEVLGKAWKPRRMVRSYKPTRHLIPAGEQVSNPSIDMIPRHSPYSSLAERKLVVGIELTQVMKQGRSLDVRDEVRRRLATVAEHVFSTLPRPAAHTLYVPFVGVRFRA